MYNHATWVPVDIQGPTVFPKSFALYFLICCTHLASVPPFMYLDYHLLGIAPSWFKLTDLPEMTGQPQLPELLQTLPAFTCGLFQVVRFLPGDLYDVQIFLLFRTEGGRSKRWLQDVIRQVKHWPRGSIVDRLIILI